MTKAQLFRFDYYSRLMRTPCRRRNRLTLDDRIEARLKLREYLKRKNKSV